VTTTTEKAGHRKTQTLAAEEYDDWRMRAKKLKGIDEVARRVGLREWERQGRLGSEVHEMPFWDMYHEGGSRRYTGQATESPVIMLR
jgi:hypothetical protein